MSDQLSLGNRVRKISFKQFKDLSCDFKKVVEKEFNTGCGATIQFMEKPKVKSMNIFVNEACLEKVLKHANEKNILTELHTLSSVTKQLWDKSDYVEVSLMPYEKESNKLHSQWATLEFKGQQQKSAAYNIHGLNAGINQIVKTEILKNHKLMVKGNGWKFNSVML